MVGIFDLAKTICKMSGWNLTHLKLQKVLYILQTYHLGRYDRPLFYGNFEAWDYGPVEPGVYSTFAYFGADPLPEWAFLEYEFIEEKNKDFPFIKELLNELLSKSARFLVTFTHDSLGAWRKLYKANERNIQITNEDMKAEYGRRLKNASSR
jgi:uncharacterized phage-associated protein